MQPVCAPVPYATSMCWCTNGTLLHGCVAPGRQRGATLPRCWAGQKGLGAVCEVRPLFRDADYGPIRGAVNYATLFHTMEWLDLPPACLFCTGMSYAAHCFALLGPCVAARASLPCIVVVATETSAWCIVVVATETSALHSGSSYGDECMVLT